MEVAQQLLQEIEYPRRGGAPLNTLRQFIAICKESDLRMSAPVARSCIEIIAKHSTQISEDELWNVYEQGCISCLDCGLLDEGEALSRKVTERFPKSFRAKKLAGMVLEAKGKFTEAELLYDAIIKDDPLNLPARQRKVAIAKARGGPAEAISVLTKHLETFVNDKDGWEELSELYLATGMHKQAAFCLEELIQMSPGHYPFFLRYAEILYAMGGRDNYIAARKYYARAVELTNGASIRGLYGIIACQAQLDAPAGKGAVEVLENNSAAAAELGITAAKALVEAYRAGNADEESFKAAKTMLEANGLQVR